MPFQIFSSSAPTTYGPVASNNSSQSTYNSITINVASPPKFEDEPRIDLACVDCAHCFIPRSEFFLFFLLPFPSFRKHNYRCRKSINTEESSTDLITGKQKTVHHTCRYARLHPPQFRAMVPDGCGESGKLWTPKHKKDLFKALTK